MNFCAVTWNPTYCQKVSVVGALAFTRGALNSAGFTSSPVGAAGACGCAPPIWADARRTGGSTVAAAEASPRWSSPRRVMLGRLPSADPLRGLLSVIADLPVGTPRFSLRLRHPQGRQQPSSLSPRHAP